MNTNLDRNEQGTEAYVELSFSPNVTLVSTVREFVSSFYQEIIHDAAVGDRLAIATHELLENAVRYASDGRSYIRVSVRSAPEATFVSINTRNRASPSNIETAREQLDALAAATDPNAHYIDLMRKTAKRAEGSGLGLGRVCAETDMRIAYSIEGEIVAIQAEARFDKTGEDS